MLVVLKWNIYAVVLSKIIFSGAICILNAKALRDRIGYVQEKKKTFLIPTHASLIMGVIAIVIHLIFELFAGPYIATIIALLAAVAAYGVSIVALGGITEEELLGMPKGAALVTLCRRLHLIRGVSMRPVKKIALLHDICGVGKAAMMNMTPILSMMGIEVCPVPTVLLSTHTGGYGTPAVCHVPGDYIRACADHYKKEHITFDAIFVGYLGKADVIDAVIYFISQFPDTKVILDPIMGDHGVYYTNFDESYGAAMRKILPYADIILPNLTEMYLLAGKEYQLTGNHRNVLHLCEILRELGAKNMIITSVPKDDCKKGIVLYEDNAFLYIGNGENLKEFHGAGDAFDGMFLAKLLQGNSLLESVQASHAFVCACIRESEKYDYPEREGLLIERTLKKIV